MKRMAALLPLVVILVGCSSAPSSPTPTVTRYVEVPGPTVTVTAAPPAAPETGAGLVFEALGEGTANVTWTSGGTVVQKEVSLPFSTLLTEGTYTAGVVQRMTGDVGCRLTLNGTVIAEKPVQPGQLYAECVSKD